MRVGPIETTDATPTEGAALPGPGRFADTAVTVLLGALVLSAAYSLVQRFLPFSIYDEVDKKRNKAVAIIVLAIVIGLGIILSAAIKPES